MYLLVSASATLLNTAFLLWFVNSHSLGLLAYFVFTQIVLTGMTIDGLMDFLRPKPIVNHQALTSITTDRESLVKQESLENGKFTNPVQFEMDERMDFVTQPVERVVEPKIKFVTFSNPNNHKSDLAIFDDLMRTLDKGSHRLVMANFHSHLARGETLIDFFDGLTTRSKILCKEISKNTDLIPYVGDLKPWRMRQINDFIREEAENYDQIILFLSPQENKLFTTPDSTPVEANL